MPTPPQSRAGMAALASALLLAALLIGPALGADQAHHLYMPLLHKPGTPSYNFDGEGTLAAPHIHARWGATRTLLAQRSELL